MFTPRGKFAWYELMTSDTKAAGRFYSDVVGWTAKEMPGDGTPYTTFNVGDAGIAGMLHMAGHTAWVGYIAVDDVDAHIEKIVEAGGKLWRPATDVPGMLRFAVMSDPQGAAIVVFTPHPAMPSPERPASPTPGTIGWHELYTTDLEGGFEFYSKTFGWTKVSDMDMGPAGTYRIFDEGDHKQMGDGGMMTKAPEYSSVELELLLQRRFDQSRAGTRSSGWREGPERSESGAWRRLGAARSRPSRGYVRAL